MDGTVVQALQASKETSSPREHNQALLDTLHWKMDTLAEIESTKLTKLISEYQDMFSLNNSELNSINLLESSGNCTTRCTTG